VLVESSDGDDREPFRTDNHGLPGQTSDVICTSFQKYIQEEMPVVDTEENHGNVAETPSGESNKTVTEAADICLANPVCSSVNSAAMIYTEEDGKIIAGEDRMLGNIRAAERHGNEKCRSAESRMMIGDGDLTGCTVPQTEDDKDDKQEMPNDDSESVVVHDNNLCETEMLELDYGISWHPKHSLLNYYSYFSDLTDEIISDKNVSLELKDEDLTGGLTCSDQALLSPVKPQEDDVVIVAGQPVSDVVEPTVSIPASISVTISPCLLREGIGEVAVSEDAGMLSTDVTGRGSVQRTEYNSIIPHPAGVNLLAETFGRISEGVGVDFCSTSCCDVTEIVPSSSLSAYTSANMELSVVNSSSVDAGENAVCSDVTHLATDTKLLSKEDRVGAVTAPVSKPVTTVSSDAVDAADGQLSYQIVASSPTDDKFSVLVSKPMIDLVSLVTDDNMAPAGSVDQVISECATDASTVVSSVQTAKVEQSGNGHDTVERIQRGENDDDNIPVVVCNPFPIFLEYIAHSDRTDNLDVELKNTEEFSSHQSTGENTGRFKDETAEDAYALIVQPDVPEPSDEVYLSTTVGSRRSSSERQSKASREGTPKDSKNLKGLSKSGRLQKRAASLGHKNQQSQRDSVDSTEPAVDQSCRSLPKASSSIGRSHKPVTFALDSCGNGAAVQQGKQNTEKSSQRMQAKSRCKAACCQETTTGGPQMSSVHSSDNSAGNQQNTEKPTSSMSSASRRSLPNPLQDSCTSKRKGKPRRSVPCVQPGDHTPAARKRPSSESRTQDAKKGKA